jgi:hypothetical protein
MGKVNIYRVSSVSKDGDSEPCPEASVLVTPCQEQATTSARPVRINRARQRVVVDVD